MDTFIIHNTDILVLFYFICLFTTELKSYSYTSLALNFDLPMSLVSTFQVLETIGIYYSASSSQQYFLFPKMVKII